MKNSLGPLLFLLAGAVLLPGRAAAGSPCPTIQVLGFERVGEDGRMDWLIRGLPELVAMTAGRACLDRIAPREPPPEPSISQKRPRLREGEPPGPAADFLLHGSFFVDDGEIVVESLLRRSADETLLAVAQWRGPAAEALSAPAALTRTMLEQLGLPFDEQLLAELGRGGPAGLAAATAFYRGLAARDGGEHEAALAHFRECARLEGGFLRARREAFGMLLVLGRSAEAADFALDAGAELEARDLPHALEFLHLASKKSMSPGGSPKSALALLERIDRLALRHEAETGETAALKRRIVAQVTVLADGHAGSGSELLARIPEQWRLWRAEIPGELERRARTGGFSMVQRDGRWVQEPLPEPTVGMWRLRALLDLARLHAREGRIEPALAGYRRIVGEYDFLDLTGLFGEESNFYWTWGIRLEAHFMILRFLKETGRLVRDPILAPHLNDVRPEEVFVRDFADPSPDRRARVRSRRDDGGHEYFDFAAPEGRKIARVRFESEVQGPAWLEADLPDPKGWPPQFSFSRRFEKRLLPKGRSEVTIEIPEGGAFLSLSILWGPRWANSLKDVMASLGAPRDGKPSIAWWKATFDLVPVQGALGGPKGAPEPDADRRLIEHYAGRWGWEGKVVRPAAPGTESAADAAQSQEWLPFAADGALFLLSRRDFRVRGLPAAIDGEGPESAPQIVPTHEGEQALLWTRSERGAHGERLAARTADLREWRAPRRLLFASARGAERPAQQVAEGDGPIMTVSGGYLMLLEEGWTRSSPDLVQWAAPRRTFSVDGRWRAVTWTKDGRLWAVLTQADDRELAPGEKPDPHAGFWRSADGRTFAKRVTVLVATSRDGETWSTPQRIHTGSEPSGLWVFPVDEGRVAIALGYGSLELRFLVGGAPEGFEPVASAARLPIGVPEAVFFLQEGRLWCGRVVHDFINQETVLLLAGSAEMHRRFTEVRP